MPTILPSNASPSEDESAKLPGEDEGSKLESLVDSLVPPSTEAEAEQESNEVTETEADPLRFQLPGLDDREHSLPIRQGDLTRMLLAEPGLNEEDKVQLKAFGAILGATFHSEFYNDLQYLKELYAPLDPDSEYLNFKDHSIDADANSDERFLEALDRSLIRANYRVLDLTLIEQAVSAPNENGLTYVPDFTLFEHLKIWVRGYTRITRDCRNARTRFRKRTIQLDAYQRLVVALKFKPDMDLGPNVRSDALYMRMFKDVPHVDMEMHLPEQGTRVRMRMIDKAQIASPIFMGIPTLATKLLAASLAMSWGMIGGIIVAPISAGVNSFFGFHRARRKHLSEMIHRLYYLTLANNSSVLTRLIDSAEDEEYKEAMLAYFFLWRANDPSTPTPTPVTALQLDERIEAYLAEKTKVSINFEVSDALAKLVRLGLASHDDAGGWQVVPLNEALTILDRKWDKTFRYP